MKKTLYLFICFIVLSSCASSYRPSNALLLRKGFVVHHPGESKQFDVYEYTPHDNTFNSILYYPANRNWSLSAGRDGYTLSHFLFTVDSRKELVLILSNFNNKK